MIKIRIQEFLIETVQLIRGYLLKLIFQFDYSKLSRLRYDQREKFDLLKRDFLDFYQSLERYDIYKDTAENFKKVLARIGKAFFPNPKFSFLTNPTIKYVMLFTRGGNSLKRELAFLERKFPAQKLQELLLEDFVGYPPLMNSKYLTSHNTVHHLYHLAYYQEKTGIDFRKINTIVEWGGGYGNLAKIFKRLVKKETTYIIFDVPLFSCVEWLYLTTIFGKEKVNLLITPKGKIQKGKFNLIPSIFKESYRNIKADLFISTWAISECCKDVQDFVFKQKWFGAKHLLLGYSENCELFPCSEKVGEFAEKNGAKIEHISFLSGFHYAFK